MIQSQTSLCAVLVLNECKSLATIQLIVSFPDFSKVKNLEDLFPRVAPSWATSLLHLSIKSKKGKLKGETIHFSLLFGLIT